jgi:hypothetical protein
MCDSSTILRYNLERIQCSIMGILMLRTAATKAGVSMPSFKGWVGKLFSSASDRVGKEPEEKSDLSIKAKDAILVFFREPRHDKYLCVLQEYDRNKLRPEVAHRIAIWLGYVLKQHPQFCTGTLVETELEMMHPILHERITNIDSRIEQVDADYIDTDGIDEYMQGLVMAYHATGNHEFRTILKTLAETDNRVASHAEIYYKVITDTDMPDENIENPYARRPARRGRPIYYNDAYDEF